MEMTTKEFSIKLNGQCAECELYDCSRGNGSYRLEVHVLNQCRMFDYIIESYSAREALTMAKLQTKMLLMNVAGTTCDKESKFKRGE